MKPGAGRPRLLFVHLHPAPFVLEDIALLEQVYDVRVFHFAAGGGGAFGRALRTLAGFVRETVWMLRHWRRAAIVYGWFADYHLALPVFLSLVWPRPVAVVLGGFEANLLPELGYGVLASRWRAPLARLVLRRASLLLPVSASLIEIEDRYSAWPRVRRNGIRAHLPGLRTRIEVLPTGYDPEVWPAGPPDRPAWVCTVAGLADDRTLRVKGIDLLLQAARLVPEVSIRVVGVSDTQRIRIPERYGRQSNVAFLPSRPRRELGAVYRGCSVYVQLSRSEGLPNVLCEAMLSGCIPVVSRVGGMPEAVGPTGWIVDTPEPEAIAHAIRQALSVAGDPARAGAARAATRARMLEQYSPARRRQRLLELLEGLRAPSSP